MKSNEKYFARVSGRWNWTVNFQLVSLNGLFTSSIRWDHKLRVIGMILNQIIFGPFSMKSQVDTSKLPNLVQHHLQIIKWGMVFYRSEKRIALDSNGFDLGLDGDEYFWPFLFKAQSFKNFKARVDNSFISAKYEWPLFGAKVHCETLLGSDHGLICTDAGWLRCTFKLTPTSMAELNQRS